MGKKKSVSVEQEEQLQKEIETLVADEQEQYEERQDVFDYITDELCGLSDENFRQFIRSIRLRRRANRARGKMSANA